MTGEFMDSRSNPADAAPTTGAAIVLYCDLKVDPAREREMLDHFHSRFKPVGASFTGFIDVKMVRLRTLIQGAKLADGVNYRFQLTYESEDLRQIWVASPEHAEVWAGIETCLTDKSFHVSLWDDAALPPQPAA